MKTKILESKYIVKALSFLTLCFLIYSRHKISYDDLIQLSTTVNYLNGYGFCLKFYDGEYIIHEAVNSWPMLYRILAIPFIFFTQNIEISSILIKIFTYLFLYLTLYYYFSSLFKNKKEINIALNICFCFITVSIAPFNYGGVTDILSVCFILLCCLFAYKYFFVKSFPKYLFLFFLCITITLNLRYAYLPTVLLVLFCFFLLEIKFKTFKKNLFLKIVLLVFFVLNVILIVSNVYFLSSTEILLDSIVENKTIWSYYYSVFFSPLFPDYIILNAVSKFLSSSNTVYFLFYSMVVIFSFVSGYVVFSFFYKRFVKIGDVFLESSLVFCVLVNLISLFVPFGVFGTYSEKNLTNISYFTNALLASQDRYQLLASVSIFILVLYYALISDKKIFQYLLISSFIFNLSHFIYLNTRYNLSRYENMKIASLPEGSYNDCLNINDLLIKEQNHNILFIENYKLNSELEKRQINPGKYVVSAGLTLFINYTKSRKAIKRERFNKNTFDKIVYCDFTKNSNLYLEKYNCTYSGYIYSLFEKNDK